MNGGGCQSSDVALEMGAVIQDFGVGGGRPLELWNTLQDGHSGNPIVWTRDLGDDLQDQANPFQIPPQGSLLLRRNSFEVRHVNAVGVPIFGGSYGDSGPRGNGDILPPPTEYHHPVYCNSYDTGDMSNDRTSYVIIVKQRWRNKGLEGVRVALRLTEGFVEAGTDTEAEEQRGDVE